MKNLERGFTLVELLVVSGIMIIITTMVVSILFTVLRGTKNSDSNVIVRQNGEQAMAQIVKTLRYAKSLDAPSTCDGSIKTQIKVTAVDLTKSTFTCPSTPFTAPNFIDMNGLKLTNSADVFVNKACSFVCTQQTGGPPTIGISFTLDKLNSTGLIEGNAEMSFKSSVTLRNLGGQ